MLNGTQEPHPEINEHLHELCCVDWFKKNVSDFAPFSFEEYAIAFDYSKNGYAGDQYPFWDIWERIFSYNNRNINLTLTEMVDRVSYEAFWKVFGIKSVEDLKYYYNSQQYEQPEVNDLENLRNEKNAIEEENKRLEEEIKEKKQAIKEYLQGVPKEVAMRILGELYYEIDGEEK